LSAKSAGQVLQGQTIQRGPLGTAYLGYGVAADGTLVVYEADAGQAGVGEVQPQASPGAGTALVLLGLFSLAVLAGVVLSKE
jgi:hypothetical protein